MKQGYHSYFIYNKKTPLKFGNMEDARQAALKEGAKKAYLALSKTYAETNLVQCGDHQAERYDYSPIPLYSGNNHHEK